MMGPAPNLAQPATAAAALGGHTATRQKQHGPPAGGTYRQGGPLPLGDYCFGGAGCGAGGGFAGGVLPGVWSCELAAGLPGGGGDVSD
jgi:hypothetical protein